MLSWTCDGEGVLFSSEQRGGGGVCGVEESSRPHSQRATSGWSVEFHGPHAQGIVLEQPPSVRVLGVGGDRGCSIQLSLNPAWC